MDEKMVGRDTGDEIEIDLQRLLTALLNKAWLAGIVAFVCAVGVFLGTYFFVTPLYQSSAVFYVNNSSLNVGDVSISGITSGDISASKDLVSSYIVILKTRESLKEVIDYAGVDRTYGQVSSMISAASVSGTEIFRVVVTSPDPQEAEQIADAVAYILPKRISSIIEGTSAKVVDSAVLPVAPSSPNYTKNAMMGFLLGLVASCGLIVLLELLDVTIRSEDDIQRCGGHPVLAAVPNMAENSHGEYYYGYGYGHRKKKSAEKPETGEETKPKLIGGDISFAASEAYKLLRTKLQFSFADEGECRIIGVSSALVGEGKSLTSVNLAYSMSQLGKRVLLIDCDMRRPSIAKKLPVERMPGLSDYLAGQCQSDNLIQLCGIQDEERAFHVISAGRIPPNPMELLSSSKMEKMLIRLQASYDYIILDLPPVGEVGDALVVSKFTDGLLTVVRQNYCDRVSLNTALRQMEFVGAKLLGVVFNCTADSKRRYGRWGYGKKGYRRYYQYYRKYAAYRASRRAAAEEKQQ